MVLVDVILVVDAEDLGTFVFQLDLCHLTALKAYYDLMSNDDAERKATIVMTYVHTLPCISCLNLYKICHSCINEHILPVPALAHLRG